MLTEVEEAFRCLKNELGLRPTFHQIDRRVKGHFLVTLLAYHVMRSILHQLEKSDIHIRWATLRLIMSTQGRVTTTLTTKDGKKVHVRASTSPDPIHRKIYHALGLPHTPGKFAKTIL